MVHLCVDDKDVHVGFMADELREKDTYVHAPILRIPAARDISPVSKTEAMGIPEFRACPDIGACEMGASSPLSPQKAYLARLGASM